MKNFKKISLSALLLIASFFLSGCRFVATDGKGHTISGDTSNVENWMEENGFVIVLVIVFFIISAIIAAVVFTKYYKNKK